MKSHQVQELLVFFAAVSVYADGMATIKAFTSCRENLLVRVDGLAVTGDENHIRGLFIVVESGRVDVSEGSVSEARSFLILTSEVRSCRRG